MSLLTILFILKIGVTALTVVLPFLVFPERKLAQLTGVEGGGPFFRLYGVAILALLVGYASAFPLIALGQFPWGIAIMGLVSNGGATVVLLMTGQWQSQKLFTLFFAGIAVCLALACLDNATFMRPLW